jgi:hypothetical protein
MTCGTSFSQGIERTSFSKEELLENSITWLADIETEDTLHVYKLSCPSCVMELKEAFTQSSQPIGAINFSTYKKEDRPLAQALLATTLSHKGEEKRKEIFGELLRLFVESADQYHKNSKEWLELCFGFWNTDEVDVGDKATWAEALNWMDRQNRINMLMDLTAFPGSLELKETNPIPPIRTKTYRDQYTLVALALPWLKYPEIHPVKGQAPSANHPENMPLTFLNPLRPLSTQDWEQFSNKAQSGTFWNFIGDPEIVLHDRMTEFVAAFLEMPTDAARRDAFAEAIQTIADTRGSSKSLLATLPRIKDQLPQVKAGRQAALTSEAHEMLEHFLVYDRIRRE